MRRVAGVKAIALEIDVRLAPEHRRSDSNDITIRPRVPAGDLHKRIAEALKRQAEREANRLEIQVEGAVVTLRGQVHSWRERDGAQGAACSVPGVRTVFNELLVD